MDLEENTTDICKIIAVYWPKPLKTLQTTALLGSPHRVIDSLFSPKSTVAQALFSLLSTGQKAGFHCHSLDVIKHHSPVLVWQGSVGVLCLLQQRQHSWLTGVPAPLTPANCGVSSRSLICPCTAILKKKKKYKKGLKQPVYAMVTCWYCLQMRKPWSLSFLVEQNTSAGLFQNKRMDLNAVKNLKGTQSQLGKTTKCALMKQCWVKPQSVLLWSSTHKGIQWGRRARHAEI